MHCLQLGSGVLVWSTRLVSENQNDREIKSAPVVAKNVVIVGTHAGTVAGQVQLNDVSNAKKGTWLVVCWVYSI